MTYATCSRGCTHWGSLGAAGVLVHCDGYVLLQLRGAGEWTNCWSVPGGAIEPGETALHAALREAREEVLGFPDELYIDPEPHINDHGGWAYRTFVAESATRPEVSPTDWESKDIAWVRADQVEDLRLHPGFLASWPLLRHAVRQPALT